MITPRNQNTSDRHNDATRRLLDARLADPLTDEEYRFLELRGARAEIEATPQEGRDRGQALRRALRLVADLRRARGVPAEDRPTRSGEMTTDDRDRRYALSRLLAIEAERSSEVQSFREHHLGGGPMEWAEIEDWIESRAAAEGEHSQYVQVVLPPGASLRVTTAGNLVDSPVALRDLEVEGKVEAKFLSYGVPAGKWVKSVAVKHGGVLDELRRLSERLAHEYSWTKDQATVFVLAKDVTPYMVGIRQETEVHTEHPAASKIRLEIDPVVAPVEVLSSYSTLRRKVLEGTYRPLREKHLKLAVFAAERRPDAKWGKVMEAWNAEHPDDTYKEATIFARDCTAAQRRLLRPRLDEDALH
jgi:hypothetical protein